ncbi:hypothetical protein VTN49DRAFT_7923 [Thermomyces lanuginosus]|uniref:uncharacterized protein n=1 Tax=Thermomyces lanuginosus TaxID=5541 RepID=UPI0037445389
MAELGLDALSVDKGSFQLLLSIYFLGPSFFLVFVCAGNTTGLYKLETREIEHYAPSRKSQPRHTCFFSRLTVSMKCLRKES